MPKAKSDQIAPTISGAASRGSEGFSGASRSLVRAVQLDFAHSTSTVVHGMAAAMALAFIVTLQAMPPGRVQEPSRVARGEPQPGPIAARDAPA